MSEKQISDEHPQSNDLLLSCFQEAHMIVIALDQQQRIISINEWGCSVFGCDENEIEGTSLLDHYEPESERNQVRDFILERLSSENNKEMKMVSFITTAAHDIVHVEWYAYLMKISHQFEKGVLLLGHDTSEHQKREMYVKKREKQLEQSIDTAPIGIYQTAPDGRILSVNKIAITMLGYDSFEELADRNIEHDNIQIGISRNEFKELIEQRGEVKGLETTWRRKDTSLIYVRENARAIRNECNEIIYYEGTLEDITEQKQAALARKESEEKYRNVVENSHAGILILDEGFHFIYVNDELCNILAYPREEVISHDFRDFLDENDKLMVTERYTRRQSGEDMPSRYQFTVLRKDGERRQVIALATIMNDSEGNVRTVGQILDITERFQIEEALRESEERYRNLIETMPEGFGIRDERGRIIYINDQVSRMLGYSREELTGQYLMDFIAPSSIDLFKEHLVRRESGEVTSYELDWISRDGRTVPTIISSKPIYDKEGLFKGSFAVLTDISIRKEAEARLLRLTSELKKANKELRTMNELKNKFLGIAAHDLRNPLAAIRGASEFLSMTTSRKDSEEHHELLTMITSSSEYMLSLVNDLLDISVIESGNLELDRKMNKLNDVLIERLRLMNVLARKKGSILNPHLIDKPEFLFDKRRIAQVIDNLLSNAIKFSPPGATITITLANEGEEYTGISVEDEGPGIPPQEINSLFGEFQQLSPKATTGERGTGLGLSICKKIMKAHNGTIDVRSTVGKGSIFSVTLPMYLKEKPFSQ